MTTTRIPPSSEPDEAVDVLTSPPAARAQISDGLISASLSR